MKKEKSGRSNDKAPDPVKKVKQQTTRDLSTLDSIALWITKKVGSMGFFVIIFGWTVIWLGWNTLVPKESRFDPFPAFVFWLFISNVIQILLMPLIMVGQNLQGRYAEARAEADFEVNVKAELQNEKILTHLSNQTKLILQILERDEKEKLSPKVKKPSA
jgi:uncharacterized membrane protein